MIWVAGVALWLEMKVGLTSQPDVPTLHRIDVRTRPGFWSQPDFIFNHNRFWHQPRFHFLFH